MENVLIVVLSDPRDGGDEALGRLLNALAVAYDLRHSGVEFEVTFQGAGSRWADYITDPNHPAHELYQAVEDSVRGISSGCADVFGARDAAEREGFDLVSEHEPPGTTGLPSLVERLEDDCTILTF